MRKLLLLFGLFIIFFAYLFSLIFTGKEESKGFLELTKKNWKELFK